MEPLKWAIDGVLVFIVALCAWRGYRNGFIRGILGILALVVSIYGANLAATAYSGEFTGMLEPFVSGVVDKAISGVMTTDGTTADTATDSDAEPADQEMTSVYDVSYNALRKIGISEDGSQLIAEKVGGEIDVIGQTMSDVLTQKLCQALAYIAVFIIAFILISIIFAVIGNIFNLAFSIPGLGIINRLIGLVMGLAIGIVIVFVLAVAARYLGLISAGTLENTVILNYLLSRNPIADVLGV